MQHPSVLLPAVNHHSSPPSRTPRSFPAATHAPTASTSAIPYSDDQLPQLHCSQCKRERPVTDFPIRLINLQPYLVCLAHEWYWTEAKRSLHWAPETTSSLQEACTAFTRIAHENPLEYEDRFMLDGDEGDMETIVSRLAAAGDWTYKKMTPRASRAKPSHNDPPPPPMFLYGLRERMDAKTTRYKLTVYFHRDVRKFTMTLKPEGKRDRSAGPWARPERTRSNKPRQEENGSEPPPPPPPVTAPGAKPMLIQHPMAEQSDSLSRAQIDAQQMPPPPIPSRKKARRVEPSLVSPSPSRPPNSSFPSQNLTYSSSTLGANPFAHLQQPWPVDPENASLPNPPASFYNSNAQYRPSQSSSSSSASRQFLSSDALTLFEMLANPAFDPPIIPLLPRPRTISTSTSSHRAPAAISVRTDTTPQQQTTPVASGKELDDAVADALGGRTPRGQEEEDRDQVLRSDHDEDDYYEDSIPDDSSQDDDGRDDTLENEEEDDDDDDESSFFESSAEEEEEAEDDRDEVDHGDSDENEDDDDDDDEEEEEEEDWLAGFVSKQMPGMVEEDDSGPDESKMPSRLLPSSRRKSPIKKRSSRPSKRSRRTKDDVLDDEDEVDQLESSGGE
ncbi:uncharacterized protein JCM15063_001085 [Sporobolomyces koalae]|uniref:uncharacterized protein n=1 Tax=Sporobolomyces koalae TaxID=500713 RepID=UPI00316EC2C1